MMKTRMLVVSALLGIAVMTGACSDDFKQGNPEENKPEGEGYFSFGLDNLPKTRFTDIPTESGEIEEQQVAYMWMLLYGAEDEKLKYAYELDATNIDPDDPNGSVSFYGADIASSSTDSGFTTVGYKVAMKEYKVVVIINPIYFKIGNYISDFTMSRGVEGYGINENDLFYNLSTLMAVNNGDGVDYDAYGDPDSGIYIHDTSGGLITYGDGKTKNSGKLFMMTNANGATTVPVSALRESAESAETTPSANIKTDRVFAKVMVNENDPGNTPIVTGGTLLDLTYGIRNMNKHVYPIRLFARMHDPYNSENYYLGEMETEEYWEDEYRENIYAGDYNFDTDSSLSDFRHTANDSYIPWNRYGNISLYSANEERWFYVPENTMNLSVQESDDWANYTTMVHIKAIISYPFGELSGDNNSYYSWYNDDDPQTDEWKVFSHEQALKWMTDGFPPEMEPLKNLIGYTDNGIFKEGSSSFFSEGVSSVQPVTSGNACLKMDLGKTLTFHYDGYNEYLVPIKHFDPQNAEEMTAEQKRKNIYGHYGVVRNNVYRVTIRSINGPGTPLNGWIATDISINKWYKRTQIEDL